MMTDMARLYWKALETAGYAVQVTLRPSAGGSGWAVLATRNQDDLPMVLAYGETLEKACERACQMARIPLADVLG